MCFHIVVGILVFQLSMRPEFSGCGHHSHVCAPISHLFIFLNISENTALQGSRKRSGPAGCHFYTHVFWVIVYIPQHQYISLPVNRVKQSSLRSSPTCPPPILSEAHPGQLARVPVSHKHESKRRVLPPDFPGSNKGNGRNKKQCRVAEITNSTTFLKCDGFFSKIFGRGSTNQTRSLALAAPHFTLICCKGKIIYTCILFWCKTNSHRKRGKKNHAETLSAEWMNFLETTGAQHSQGKHHWTQSRVSRYCPCVCVGLYFSLADSCFRRLWPQFHRGHLLIKGKDWNLQVLNVCSLKPRKFN